MRVCEQFKITLRDFYEMPAEFRMAFVTYLVIEHEEAEKQRERPR